MAELLKIYAWEVWGGVPHPRPGAAPRRGPLAFYVAAAALDEEHAIELIDAHLGAWEEDDPEAPRFRDQLMDSHIKLVVGPKVAPQVWVEHLKRTPEGDMLEPMAYTFNRMRKRMRRMGCIERTS